MSVGEGGGGDLVLERVSRVHDDGTVALAGIDLRVAAGEIVALVGPSGAGKSTLLRLVAGLEAPTTGSIRIGERVLDGLGPGARDVALAVEGRGLFPHLTVEDNLRFPLRARRTREREVAARVDVEARVMQLLHVLDRRPATLSAGELQRLSVGKATIRVPSAFLFDEPLSHLDPGERASVAGTLALLLRGLHVPSVVVTHDVRQAMTMGDRLAVLERGVLHQVGPGRQLYARPATVAVARAVGDPAMALVLGTLEVAGGVGALVVGDARLAFPAAGGEALRGWLGRTVLVGVRPEHLEVVASSAAGTRAGTLASRIERIEHTGSAALVTARLHSGDGDVVVRIPAWSADRRGDDLHLRLDPTLVSLFDPASGVALWHGR